GHSLRHRADGGGVAATAGQADRPVRLAGGLFHPGGAAVAVHLADGIAVDAPAERGRAGITSGVRDGIADGWFQLPPGAALASLLELQRCPNPLGVSDRRHGYQYRADAAG